MPRSHGIRRKSRSILTKDNVVRGISYLLHDYKVGEKVVVDVDPREHITTPHRRFHGRIGFVEEVGKRTLKVSVTIGDKKKLLQTRFNHIKPLSNASEVPQAEATTPPPPPPPTTTTTTTETKATERRRKTKTTTKTKRTNETKTEGAKSK
jgi:large subunit ribosomal protein L21e